MKKWRVDYAYRKNGKYVEDSMFVMAIYADAAISTASAALNAMAWSCQWDTVEGHHHDRFMIWNVGIMMDADEEVI